MNSFPIVNPKASYFKITLMATSEYKMSIATVRDVQIHKKDAAKCYS